MRAKDFREGKIRPCLVQINKKPFDMNNPRLSATALYERFFETETDPDELAAAGLALCQELKVREIQKRLFQVEESAESPSGSSAT